MQLKQTPCLRFFRLARCPFRWLATGVDQEPEELKLFEIGSYVRDSEIRVDLPREIDVGMPHRLFVPPLD